MLFYLGLFCLSLSGPWLTHKYTIYWLTYFISPPCHVPLTLELQPYKTSPVWMAIWPTKLSQLHNRSVSFMWRTYCSWLLHQPQRRWQTENCVSQTVFYEYLVMPYGLTKTPTVFKAFVKEIFRVCLKTVWLSTVHRWYLDQFQNFQTSYDPATKRINLTQIAPSFKAENFTKSQSSSLDKSSTT